jgi:hypothetical protein
MSVNLTYVALGRTNSQYLKDSYIIGLTI